MPARTRDDLVETIRAALDTPERRIDIARRLGVSRQLVQRIASQHGVRVNPNLAKRFRRGEILQQRIGQITLRAMLSDLPDGTLVWLINQAPGETTIADVIRAILIDTHREATQE